MFVLKIIREPKVILYYAGVESSVYRFTIDIHSASTFLDRSHAIAFAQYLHLITGFDFEVVKFEV